MNLLIPNNITLKISVFIIWLFHICGMIGISYGNKEFFLAFTPVNLFISFVLLFINQKRLESVELKSEFLLFFSWHPDSFCGWTFGHFHLFCRLLGRRSSGARVCDPQPLRAAGRMGIDQARFGKIRELLRLTEPRSFGGGSARWVHPWFSIPSSELCSSHHAARRAPLRALPPACWADCWPTWA